MAALRSTHNATATTKMTTSYLCSPVRVRVPPVLTERSPFILSNILLQKENHVPPLHAHDADAGTDTHVPSVPLSRALLSLFFFFSLYTLFVLLDIQQLMMVAVGVDEVGR